MRISHRLVALAALLASPAFGQMTNGPGSMSPIPGTALPDASGSDVGQAARAVAEQQSAAPEGRHGGVESAAYLANLRIRRQQAEQYAAAAERGVPLPADAALTLRNELAADIDQWRGEFSVGRKQWQAMRDRWLVPLANLTAIQWAQHRVDWWAARDSWIANHGH